MLQAWARITFPKTCLSHVLIGLVQPAWVRFKTNTILFWLNPVTFGLLVFQCQENRFHSCYIWFSGKSISIFDTHDWLCLKIFLKWDELKRSKMEKHFNEIFPDRKKGKISVKYPLFLTEVEKIKLLSKVIPVNLNRFFPERDESQKFSLTYCLFFNRAEKKTKVFGEQYFPVKIIHILFISVGV